MTTTPPTEKLSPLCADRDGGWIHRRLIRPFGIAAGAFRSFSCSMILAAGTRGGEDPLLNGSGRHERGHQCAKLSPSLTAVPPRRRPIS